ncbi:MAG: SDR family NAD(P)-dependent oxidoreductase, partial [Planctomycetaceae bacterium]|nr:SDR family NAD(P)-dependent oxidoreductase [Planctomycetaceae bacterium]
MAEQAFAGKTVLVTGGTRGIGRATAFRLAAEGARIAVNYHANQKQAEDTLAELKTQGNPAIAVQANVADRDEVERMVAEVRDALGPIDILVHSAGLSIVEHATDVTWETW